MLRVLGTALSAAILPVAVLPAAVLPVATLSAAVLPAAAGLGSVAAPAAPQQARGFGFDDALNLVGVAAPRLSPDGSRVLFARDELDWDENKRNIRIWIVGTDGSGARPFTASTEDRNAEWSPDGRWVAFTRPVQRKGDEADAKPRQLFVMPAGGGEPAQLTRHPTSVGRYAWTRDGASIFFLAPDSLPDAAEKERKNGADAVFVDEGPNGQTRGSWNGVWKVDLPVRGSGLAEAPVDAVRATPQGRIASSFAVSPDGNHLAYVFRTENRRNAGHLGEIALRPARGLDGADDVAEERLTRNDAPESQLAWSPDGRRLAFVAPDLESWELDQGNLYVYDVPSGRTRQVLADFEGDLRDFRWHPGGRAVDFVALERTDANFYRVELASGEVQQLTREPGVASAPSWDRFHHAAAFAHASPTAPADIWLARLDGGGMVRLTDANPALAGKDLADPEIVRWNSADGLEIEGLLYLPPGRGAAGEGGRSPDAGQRGPGAAVLQIHGGPAGVFTRRFDPGAQILAAHGYAVLQPNVRGSSGYGDALLRGNMNDIGGGDYEDLMSGVDAMVERGVAHPDSLAVKGWSYGGILGGWTITRTDRFKAASLGAMVADWRSEFGAGFNFDVVRWYLGGDPWSNRDFWTDRSPYTHLDKVRTPTILFHGAADRTDTMEQSMNFFAGLRHLGVEARFVLFPREGHGIREPRHRRTLLTEEMRWLQGHVRGLEDWEPPLRPAVADSAATAPRPVSP